MRATAMSGNSAGSSTRSHEKRCGVSTTRATLRSRGTRSRTTPGLSGVRECGRVTETRALPWTAGEAGLALCT
jgi:hypothetical protein